MHIEYLHDSKYGNGASVAEQFRAHMAQRGADLDVHHIHDVDPRQVAQADLYVFSRMKGPLEDGWQDKVDRFADRIPVSG